MMKLMYVGCMGFGALLTVASATVYFRDRSRGALGGIVVGIIFFIVGIAGFSG